MTRDERLVVYEDDLRDLYALLSDATEAAATGDPNTCASKAADAKDLLADIHHNATPLEEGG